MATVHTNEREQRGAALGGMRVLLAEDSWHVAYAIQTVLEHAGAVVLGPAATVAELKDLAGQERFDAIVADINLHGEMASGALEALAGRGVPVVVITGYGEAPPMTPRAAATLLKPVSADQLITTLRDVTDRG